MVTAQAFRPLNACLHPASEAGTRRHVRALSSRAASGVALLLALLAAEAIAADRAGLDLERRFANTVHPFLESYCLGCHKRASST